MTDLNTSSNNTCKMIIKQQSRKFRSECFNMMLYKKLIVIMHNDRKNILVQSATPNKSPKTKNLIKFVSCLL